MRLRVWLDNEPAGINRNPNRGAGAQLQQFKNGGGTASMIEPPTLRRLVVCMVDFP